MGGGVLEACSYQSLYPLLLFLLQRDDVNFCQSSWVQTDELCRYLGMSERDRMQLSPTVPSPEPHRYLQQRAYLLQQGLHLPFLALLPAPVRVTLQTIKVGLSSS